MPSPAHRDRGNQDGCDEGGRVGAGVEQAGGQGALFGGKPFGGGFDRSGEVAGLTEAKQSAADHEADNAGDQRSADRGASPDQDRDGVTSLGAEPVDDAAGEEKADAVGDLEGNQDAAVVDVVDGLMGVVEARDPAHEGKVEERLDEREDRAVHVVDGGGKEEQEAYSPADVGFFRGSGGEARVGEAGGLDRH